MSDNSEKRLPPPYASYASFRNFISQLADDGLPSRIDRSVMSNMSGSAQSAILSSCKWLGLITEDGTPTTRMTALVKASADDITYSDELQKLLLGSYSFLREDGFELEKATGAQVAEKFRDLFGIQGSTVNKCMSFFLQAAKDADIKVSKHVKPPPLSRTNRKKRKAKLSSEETSFEVEQKPEASDRCPDDMAVIPIPLHGMKDGEIRLQRNMSEEQWSYALNMAQLILKHYRPDVEEDG